MRASPARRASLVGLNAAVGVVLLVAVASTARADETPPAPPSTTENVPAPATRDGVPWDPSALNPINTDVSSYDEYIGDTRTGGAAPTVTPVGSVFAWAKRTYIETYVMVGAYTSSGYEGAIDSDGLAVDLRLLGVSAARYLLALRGTYFRPLDSDRQAFHVDLTVGYSLWRKVHGPVVGYTEEEDMVRESRSSVYLTGSWGMYGFGTHRDEAGFVRPGPETPLTLHTGLQYELRRRHRSLTVSASALYEVPRTLWGAEVSVLAKGRRYTGGVTVRKIGDLGQQALLTSGMVF